MAKKKRSLAQRAALYARNVWGIESPPWSGAEARRLIAQAYLSGRRSGSGSEVQK